MDAQHTFLIDIRRFPQYAYKIGETYQETLDNIISAWKALSTKEKMSPMGMELQARAKWLKSEIDEVELPKPAILADGTMSSEIKPSTIMEWLLAGRPGATYNDYLWIEAASLDEATPDSLIEIAPTATVDRPGWVLLNSVGVFEIDAEIWWLYSPDGTLLTTADLRDLATKLINYARERQRIYPLLPHPDLMRPAKHR